MPSILLFATRDGMATLPRTLAAFERLRLPRGLRIVAVDNGSRDGSGALLREAAGRLPLTVIDAPVAGKNRALNFALDRIAPWLGDAELVVVTDDDVVPRTDWLLRLHAAARRAPQADLFGGSIVPVWLATPPMWLTSMPGAFPVLFAVTEARDGPCSARDIYGPNMAVRGRVLAAGARFEPGIGPDGTRRFGMGSESEFLRRMERLGHRGHFCADAVVGHQVEPAQMTLASVMARAHRYGYGLALMDRQSAPWARLAARVAPRWVERELKALGALLPFWADRRLATRYAREIRRGYVQALFTGAALPASRPDLATPPRAQPLAASAGRLAMHRLRRALAAPDADVAFDALPVESAARRTR